jgi:hypothetical protein
VEDTVALDDLVGILEQDLPREWAEVALARAEHHRHHVECDLVSETLSVALVTGLGGAIIALCQAYGWLPARALAAVFALTTLARPHRHGTGLRTLTPNSTAGTRPEQAETAERS